METQLIIALLMLLGNAFFVGAEFGLVSSRRSSIELKALEGSRAARITLEAMEQVSLMLAGAQLGVTVCSLVFGAIGEPLIAHLLQLPLHAAGLSENLAHPIAFVLALGLMTYTHVVLGEMVPKNLALVGPTPTALWLTPVLVFWVKLTKPLVVTLNAIAYVLLKLFGVMPPEEMASSFSRDEVAGFVRESHQEGLLSEDEEQLLSGALTFDKKRVRQAVLPTQTLVTAHTDASPQNIEDLSAATGYSRFPIKGSRGALQGYVHIKDLLAVPTDKQLLPIEKQFIRPLPEISASTPFRQALVQMQRKGAHLAKVVDAKHKTLGVVALEDLLEELVGVIRDETQRKHVRNKLQ